VLLAGTDTLIQEMEEVEAIYFEIYIFFEPQFKYTIKWPSEKVQKKKKKTERKRAREGKK